MSDIPMTPSVVCPFPFSVDAQGLFRSPGGVSYGPSGSDNDLRGKIIQVLFTSPGERVNLPEFGCGLLGKTFEPMHETVWAAMEFTVSQALTRWLGKELVVNAVKVEAEGETAVVQVVYTKKSDLTRQTMRIQFK